MNRIDFHTHILPNIDDGSQSVEQSLRMLKKEAELGVEIVVATPHYYPDAPVPAEFAATRKEAYERLMSYAKEQSEETLPQLRMGAEVLLSMETPELGDLRLLAIEGTDYILIEMPYDNWQEWVYEAIEKIRVIHGLTPVIAHVERYIPMQDDTDQIYRLLSLKDVLGQVNTRSIMNKASKRLCDKLIANHMVHVIGSDAHRGAHLFEVEEAYAKLEKKHGSHVKDRLISQGRSILANERIDKEMPIPFKKVFGGFYK